MQVNAYFIGLFFLLATAAGAHDADTGHKSMAAMRVEQAPQIDGVLDEQVWRQAPSREDFVQQAHNAGLVVHVFYADTPEDMRHYIGMGVDGILTNYPERLKDVICAL